MRFLINTSVGKIKAVQGEYPDAFARLTQAIRRAPENTGLGFRIQAQKLAIIVELLLVIRTTNLCHYNLFVERVKSQVGRSSLKPS